MENGGEGHLLRIQILSTKGNPLLPNNEIGWLGTYTLPSHFLK